MRLNYQPANNPKPKGASSRSDNKKKTSNQPDNTKPKGASRSDDKKKTSNRKLLVPRQLDVKQPDNLLAQARSASAGITSNEKEMVWNITDFFDHEPDSTVTPAKSISAVDFNLNQSFIGTADSTIGDSGTVYSRVKRVRVWVLPKADNANVASTGFITATAVKGETNTESTSATKDQLVNISNTVIKPDFNIEWIKVMDYNVDRLFDNTTLRPSITNDNQEIFRFTTVNLDDGALFPGPVQVMYTVTFAQVLPVLSTAKIDVNLATGWLAGVNAGTTSKFALVDVIGIQNKT